MSKTKAQLEAELKDWALRETKLVAEALAREKAIMDLRDEATGWHQHAKQLEDELADEMHISLTAANARVHRVADRKPWRLISIVAVVAFWLGWVL